MREDNDKSYSLKLLSCSYSAYTEIGYLDYEHEILRKNDNFSVPYSEKNKQAKPRACKEQNVLSFKMPERNGSYGKE